MKYLLSFHDFLNESKQWKPGAKATHAKYGSGVIVKDKEGVCNSDEVLFKPDDNSVFLGLNVLGNGGDKALWSEGDKAKYDIVKVADLSEASLYEGLKETKLSEQEVEAIWNKLKDYVKTTNSIKNPDNVQAYDKSNIVKYAGDFGITPDTGFKIASIYATTFDLLICVTTPTNSVVCYATMSYDTLGHKFKDKTYIGFLDTHSSNFGQKTRQYKVHVYSGI